MSQRRLGSILILVIVGAVAFGFLRGTFAGGATPPPAAAQPGSQAVYQRIAADTDCTALQAEFDQAYADHEAAAAGSDGRTWTTAYMSAANDRMTTLGCP
jgi:hypothetical protein